MSTLKGSVAIISGGLGDIGRGIALELASRGADIAVGDVLEAENARELLATLRTTGRRGRYDRVDVTDAAAVQAWVATVEADMGLADLIIPNAAIVTLKEFRDVTPGEWSHELNINLNGAFHLAQATTLRLVAAGRPGRVVFLGSWVGHAPQKHIPTYCVAKAGLRMLMRCMARDLAPAGILVNEVAPGNVDAGLSGQIFKLHPERKEAVMKVTPVGKLVEVEDVAWQVANLCEPRNNQATGTVMVMDGGLSLLA